jgi:hypothetical protein
MDARLTNPFNAIGAFWKKPKGALFLFPNFGLFYSLSQDVETMASKIYKTGY